MKKLWLVVIALFYEDVIGSDHCEEPPAPVAAAEGLDKESEKELAIQFIIETLRQGNLTYGEIISWSKAYAGELRFGDEETVRRSTRKKKTGKT